MMRIAGGRRVEGFPAELAQRGPGSAGAPLMRASSSRIAARKPAAKSSAGGAISAGWRRASAGNALASAMALRAFLAWRRRSRFLGWRGLRGRGFLSKPTDWRARICLHKNPLSS